MSTTGDPKMTPLLFKSIEAADVVTLRHVLKSLCGLSQECATLTSALLLVQKGELVSDSDVDSNDDYDEEDEEEEDDEEDADDDQNDSEHEQDDEEDDSNDEDEDEDEEQNGSRDHIDRTTKRRKTHHNFTGVEAEFISRYETCRACKARFDVTKNHPTACQIHPGPLEVSDDADAWADDDQYMYDQSSIDPETDWRRDEFPACFTWSCCEQQADAKPCQISRHMVAGPVR